LTYLTRYEMVQIIRFQEKYLRPKLWKFNPLIMRRPQSPFAIGITVPRRFLTGLAFWLLLLPALAQTTLDKASPCEPLPQDSGAAGLKDLLQRLHTTARLLQTTAHPDDEDGGMLTLESRGHGVTETLLTLNRGEGGQNKMGSNLFDVLGVLRTLELTASDRYYGVEQRFTRVADFGFSKTPDETFQKWQGHDVALSDMVRVIRTFRPDVLVSRFSGTERDGHGHHQAAGILTQEAYHAAADPNRFPEQIKEGLPPWQAKKLYIGNVCPFRSNSCPENDYTLRLNTGEESPALGMSYIQFALEGLRHQLSQGAAGWSVPAGPAYTFYRLVDSKVGQNLDSGGHEKGFFDGLDTTLPGLAARLGDEERKVPFLKPVLVELQKLVDQATISADANPEATAGALITGSEKTTKLIADVEASSLSPIATAGLLTDLNTKKDQFQRAAALAAGVHLQVFATARGDSGSDFMLVPGHTYEVTAKFESSLAKLHLKKIDLDLPKGWSAKPTRDDSDGSQHFQVIVPPDAEYTRPYWHRDNPETDAVNIVDEPAYATLPFAPPPVQAHATYALGDKESVVHAVGMSKSKDSSGKEIQRPLAMAPPFSIALEPPADVIPKNHPGTTEVTVGVRTEIATSENASVRLELPDGWKSEPAVQPINFQRAGESKDVKFQVRPTEVREGQARIKAVVDYQGKSYHLGYTVVSRDDLNTAYYYQPAVRRDSVVDVNVPSDLKVAYLMGAGDDIPAVLKEVGIDLTSIPAEKLVDTDLTRFGTVILGIRAYDTQKDVAAHNQKLLDYVSSGGTLIVQYNASAGDFNSGHFTPYPAQISRARVSVEEAPIQILAPQDRVFQYPNTISEKDFEGWVQERGLYFMDQWDNHFEPLLSSHDPGEQPQKGGLLLARYGKGTYIYTGYAFFRQLPAGVPGAIRLYVNLLSAGHDKQSSVARSQ
jgi:LmbE family N-acetylglucosaminyl deacetylase